MAPLARKLIQKRYLDHGATTRLVVLPLPESGLPDSLVSAAQPVHLDLLSGRPINLELDDQGLTADLCFSGPPTRCRFPWSAIVAVQGPDDQMVETLMVTVAMVMEDGSLRLESPFPTFPEAPKAPGLAATPRLAALPGQAAGSARTKAPAKLRLVSRQDREES